MKYVALLIGSITALYIIVRLKRSRLENRRWVYPLLLATFPVYY